MKIRLFSGLAILLAFGTAADLRATPLPEASIVEDLGTELSRSFDKLKTAGKAPLYFLCYRLYDMKEQKISATNGALTADNQPAPQRMLSVELRVGSPQLDNTHYLRSERSRPSTIFDRSSKRDSVLPATGGGLALRQALWIKTDEAFKEAQSRLLAIQASSEVLASEEDRSGDFVQQKAQEFFDQETEVSPLNEIEWKSRMRQLSAIYLEHPKIMNSEVSLHHRTTTRYIVDSEGSRVVEHRNIYALHTDASTLTDDGMHLNLYSSSMSTTLKDLPSQTEFAKTVEQLASSLDQLRLAKPADSYVGPAILSGRAAAVFFHETFGHRVEAVHEKSEVEGKTFTRKIGSPIMPAFITVTDDPTKSVAFGRTLNGHYKYDDEGVPAQSVTLAKKGVLTGFLLGRTPLEGFNRSNGHGRCAPGWNPTARQGNLFVETAQNKQHSPDELRALLIREAKKQQKEYGLYFAEISGGSTGTHAGSNQSYSIYPRLVYKIFVDGRPDQLIRGADIVGTPLAALEKIVASGTDYDVFNGTCGRDSGYVAVSGVAPSLLIQSIEIKRTAKSFEKPPIIPEPKLSNPTKAGDRKHG